MKPIRVDKELIEWFDQQFPWRGSFPQFVNAALAEFRAQWGDRESPHDLLAKAIEKHAGNY